MVQQFAAFVAPEIPDEKIDLLGAALTYAKPEYPGLDPEEYVGRVEALAERVRQQLSDSLETAEVLKAINRVLFEEEGFMATRTITTTRGIPISTKYSIARRGFR